MDKRRKPVPSHQKQSEKDRLGKKGEAFERKRHSDDRARFFHETRPEQTELEREHRSRYRADREKNGRAARPSLGQFQKNRTAGEKIKRFRNGHQHREANSHG